MFHLGALSLHGVDSRAAVGDLQCVVPGLALDADRAVRGKLPELGREVGARAVESGALEPEVTYEVGRGWRERHAPEEQAVQELPEGATVAGLARGLSGLDQLEHHIVRVDDVRRPSRAGGVDLPAGAVRGDREIGSVGGAVLPPRPRDVCPQLVERVAPYASQVVLELDDQAPLERVDGPSPH